MNHYNKGIGSFGENLATEYLQKMNYKIVKRNYRCKIGEIDIISTSNNFLCFAEVKTRYESMYGTPGEAVNRKKQIKLYKIAQFYIMQNNIFNLNFRFDVLEVILNHKNNDFTVRLIENAFQI
ncbi:MULTISPECIES: YraN family protein [Clostridium]|jgi:putative endonuclease|uniref:YraN family protein n=1 Tax=Clostridium TaxID=1485 RepID=UPI000287BF61|nr:MULTISPECIES: YraN family protein [Clostridium]MDF2502560.1 hypothetical protein [Clostridium sp.]